MLEISLVPGNSRRLAVNLTLPVSALWLTYICHIGLGGSSRSANGPVRLTLDISHSPCQWEVCIIFVCLLFSLSVCYKTSYPRPIPGTPLYLFRVWPWDPSPPCEVHALTPMALAPISPLGSQHSAAPPLHSDLFLTSRPMSLYQTRAMALLPPSPSIALQAPPPWRLPGRLVHHPSLLIPPQISGPKSSPPRPSFTPVSPIQLPFPPWLGLCIRGHHHPQHMGLLLVHPWWLDPSSFFSLPCLLSNLCPIPFSRLLPDSLSCSYPCHLPRCSEAQP